MDEGRIRFSAIDEVDAYHDAAVSGLSVSLPALNRRRARIEHIEITETLIRAGSGFAVQLNAALTVSGPWR